MKIAIYAIAKNEARFAARFAATCHAADCTIALDTGSQDDTASILAEYGVHVGTDPIVPWRFDTARNRALELVPSDIDVCLKVDLDECLSPDWRDQLEKAWKPGVTTQAWYTYTWSWKSGGVAQHCFMQNHCHARHGFVWRHRCHEALYFQGTSSQFVTIRDLHIEHHPDYSKSRASYLSLLQSEHTVEPSARSHFYLGREYYFCRRFEEAVPLLVHYLEISHFPAERGIACLYLYRMTRDSDWAYRAVRESTTRQHQLLAAQAALRDNDCEAAVRWCNVAIATPSTSNRSCGVQQRRSADRCRFAVTRRIVLGSQSAVTAIVCLAGCAQP